MQRRDNTRGDLLADLAAAINELTEPRHHVEKYDRTAIIPIDTGARRKKARRSRERRQHHTSHVSLVIWLCDAAPGADPDGPSMAGGFESRPPADMDPVSVLREISDGARAWARTLGVTRPDLTARLKGLVSARPTDSQLRELTREAERWVALARIAVGFDAPPLTGVLNCPECHARNSINVTGDLTFARCARCGAKWTHDQFGLLTLMLAANGTQETAVDVPCWMTDCTRRGAHHKHQDERGRTWGDVCDVR